MCGIAGIYDSDGQDCTKVVHSALRSIAHRGPDHSAILHRRNVTLGHNRLSIIDLNPGAHQPMSSPDGRYHIAFNGEIFNFRELRSGLEKKGVHFRTESDTEVLLHHLIEFGEGGLHDLNGFFSIAFFDEENDELLIIRDRFGEKPLWYYSDHRRLLFASGLRPLLLMGAPAVPDPASLAQYLRYTYITAPHSFYKNIFKLEPGQLLKRSRAATSTRQWYTPPPFSETMADAGVTETFAALLADSVRLRLVSDVSLGTFLSGGVDSSIIAALAAKEIPSIQTFSISFPESSFFDESPFASRVANHIGSKHTNIPVRDEELFAGLNGMVNALEEPFADSSSVAVHVLSRTVKQSGISVALSGDGADELLAGYRKHRAHLKAIQCGSNGKILWGAVGRAARWWPSGRNSTAGNLVRSVQRFAEGLQLDDQARYRHWASWSDAEDVAQLTSDSLLKEAEDRIWFNQPGSMDAVLEADQRYVLANDMLVKTDLMSMHHALEVRPPFLDHRVVEFTRQIGTTWKLDTTHQKILLRKSFSHLLPDEVFTRPKRGFEIPLDVWLRGRLAEEVRSLPGRLSKSGHPIHPATVEELVTRYLRNPRSGRESHLIFSLLVLARWSERA